MDAGCPITIVVADHHGVVREGVASFCRSRPDISVIGLCANGEEAIEMILAKAPDFAVLDLNLPRVDGPGVVRRVRMAGCRTRLIILALDPEEGVIEELFRAGANAFLLKGGPAQQLLDAIDYLLTGGDQYVAPAINHEALGKADQKRDLAALLSKREYEVFLFLSDGMRPRDIAKVLAISPKTVDTYRANIMRKLEVDGIAGLVRFAIQSNLRSSLRRRRPETKASKGRA